MGRYGRESARNLVILGDITHFLPRESTRSSESELSNRSYLLPRSLGIDQCLSLKNNN